ncbi:MAG: hypothetical protein LBR21_06390 [Propionibacteriaceae bacterium]|nr:hypothetical protein [Propionibacteriaceae bacterium]
MRKICLWLWMRLSEDRGQNLSVDQVVWIVVGLAVATMLGAFIFNFVQGQMETFTFEAPKPS